MKTKVKKVIKKKKDANAVKLGKKGGLSVVKKMGKDYMSEIGKRGAEKRWEK